MTADGQADRTPASECETRQQAGGGDGGEAWRSVRYGEIDSSNVFILGHWTCVCAVLLP